MKGPEGSSCIEYIEMNAELTATQERETPNEPEQTSWLKAAIGIPRALATDVLMELVAISSIDVPHAQLKLARRRFYEAAKDFDLEAAIAHGSDVCIWEETLNGETTRLSRDLANLASMYCKKGDFDTTVELIVRALAVREKQSRDSTFNEGLEIIDRGFRIRKTETIPPEIQSHHGKVITQYVLVLGEQKKSSSLLSLVQSLESTGGEDRGEVLVVAYDVLFDLSPPISVPRESVRAWRKELLEKCLQMDQHLGGVLNPSHRAQRLMDLSLLEEGHKEEKLWYLAAEASIVAKDPSVKHRATSLFLIHTVPFLLQAGQAQDALDLMDSFGSVTDARVSFTLFRSEAYRRLGRSGEAAELCAAVVEDVRQLSNLSATLRAYVRLEYAKTLFALGLNDKGERQLDILAREIAKYSGSEKLFLSARLAWTRARIGGFQNDEDLWDLLDRAEQGLQPVRSSYLHSIATLLIEKLQIAERIASVTQDRSRVDECKEKLTGLLEEIEQAHWGENSVQYAIAEALSETEEATSFGGDGLRKFDELSDFHESAIERKLETIDTLSARIGLAPPKD